jgi:conserved domain protein
LEEFNIQNFKQIPNYPLYFINKEGSMVLKTCNSDAYYSENEKFYRRKSKNISIELDSDKYILYNNLVYRIIKLIDNHIGYLFVKLSNDKGSKNLYIHRLVYRTFVGAIPKGMQINHINHNKHDNRIENLEVLSASENQKKAILFYGNNLLPHCKQCGSKIRRVVVSDYCYKCQPKNSFNLKNKISSRLKVKNRPSKEILENLIRNHSFVEIGKIYNVSDNAVRKWCKTYELPFRRRDIEQHYNTNRK